MSTPDLSHRRLLGQMLCEHGNYPLECLRCLQAEIDALTTQRAADAVAAMRAVEEAREEQREAIVRLVRRRLKGRHDVECRVLIRAIRATPLTATPLRERIAELEEERTEFLKADAINLADWKDHQKRAEKAEARVKELESGQARVFATNISMCSGAFEALAQFTASNVPVGETLEGAMLLASVKAERDALKAHVETTNARYAELVTSLERTQTERDALKAELAEAQNPQTPYALMARDNIAVRAQLASAEAQIERLTTALKNELAATDSNIVKPAKRKP